MSQYERDRTSEAAEYLLDRGLTPETINTFRLGVAANPAPEHRANIGKLSIPYLSAGGHPVSVRFRCIEEHDHRANGHGKYATVSGDPGRLFNVRAIPTAQYEIHLAEGEFDTIMLEQAGLPAVGIPGANNIKPHFYRLLAGFRRVWVWADPDDAGGEMARTITKRLKRAKTVPLKAGDVTETYLAHGAGGLHELINS